MLFCKFCVCICSLLSEDVSLCVVVLCLFWMKSILSLSFLCQKHFFQKSFYVFSIWWYFKTTLFHNKTSKSQFFWIVGEITGAGESIFQFFSIILKYHTSWNQYTKKSFFATVLGVTQKKYKFSIIFAPNIVFFKRVSLIMILFIFFFPRQSIRLSGRCIDSVNADTACHIEGLIL